jgi:hypothetical protein
MAEAKSLVKIGMSEKQVTEKVGKPTLIEDGKEPGNSWVYCATPPGTPGYAGFVIIFKSHMVSNLDVISDPAH